MAIAKIWCTRLLPLLGLLMWVGTAQVRAQEESPEMTRYREDYERYQKIAGISDPMKRADQLLQFVKERPNSKLLPNASTDYLTILQNVYKAAKFDTLASLAENFIKVRPRVGETYYFYGAALKEQKKYDEAINALAKCYVLKNPASDRAKLFLESVYKGQNRGSLEGLDKIIKTAQAEIAK